MYKFIVILFGMLAGNGCSSDLSRLDMALRLAGDNQAELLNALNHYSKETSDTLKFKALVFLIENMPGHFSYGGEGLEIYTDKLQEMEGVSPFTRKVLQSLFYRSGVIMDQQEIDEDIRHITSDFLIRNIERKFDMWENLPWLGKLNFDEFCEYVLPYRIENEIPEQIQDSSFVNRKKNEEIIGWYDDINYSAQGVSEFYFPKFFYFEKRLPYPFDHMYKFDCYDIGLLQLYHYRASGIPAALDFVPAWGNTNGCHYWVAVIDRMYTSTLVQPVIYRKIPKVYRYTFSRQDTLKDKNYVPELFREPFVRDVTSQYIHTTDVRFRPALTYKGIKYVYLAVFNNCKWEPVAYSSLNKKKVRFCGLGYDLVYLPIAYQGKQMLNLSYPFILERGGNRIELIPDKVQTRTFCLRRKYPYNSRARGGESMLGTVFECSNDSLFDTSVIFYKVAVNPGMNYQDIECPPVAYKYWRIRPYTYCSLSELCFTDSCGRAVEMKDMEIKSYENTDLLFDKDPLTYIEFGGVIDFVFNRPVLLRRIRYLPKNDGNGIYPGNTYELRYFDRSGWQAIGQKVATTDSVCFDSVPSGALYWLRNLTTGKEERIFTYEKNGIKFW